MATIDRENIGLLNDRIRVRVTQEDYLPNFEKALKKYSKGASLPGFRKGMVPSGLIKKMHGQAIFTEEVVKSVEKELTNYLQQEKLSLFSDPLPENMGEVRLDVNTPGEYQFNFEVGLKPDFELTPVREGLKMVRYKIKVEDKDVDEEIKQLQKRGGTAEDKESVSGPEDFLEVKLQLCDEQGEVAEGTEPVEDSLPLDYFNAGAREQLQGKQKGDAVVLPLKDAFEEKEAAYILGKLNLEEAGDHRVKVTLEKIQETVPHPINKEFFDKVYPGAGIETEEAFREKIRQDNEAYLASESDKRLDEELFETLVHQTPIELPVEFLKKLMKQQGESPKTDEEIEAGYPELDHAMRWNLISGKIIRDQELTVSPEELQADFRQRLAGYFGASAETGELAARMDEFVARAMQDEKAVDSTYQKLLSAKVLGWLRDQATIEEKEVTAEEFSKLPHNHHHHEH
jgi:trigger factor